MNLVLDLLDIFLGRPFSGDLRWNRICRPGSILGPQQQFLCDMQQDMWQAGGIFWSHWEKSHWQRITVVGLRFMFSIVFPTHLLNVCLILSQQSPQAGEMLRGPAVGRPSLQTDVGHICFGVSEEDDTKRDS